MKTGLLIKANGETQEITPKNETNFSLEEMQGFVGGYIERIVCPDGREMYCNEEGKLEGLQINDKATKIAQLSPFDCVCGDVIVGAVELFRDPDELRQDEEFDNA